MSKMIGSILLIAGCCVGVGMLGIPVMSGPAGFLPSSLVLVFAWGYMLVTGSIFAELVLSFPRDEVHLLSMTKEVLGKRGKLVAVGLFAFLFYALMCAYIIATSQLIQDGLFAITDFMLPDATALFAAAILLYVLISRRIHSIDRWNRAAMAGLVASYLLLLIFALPHVNTEGLTRSSYPQALLAIPVFIVSFGYQNLVPSLCKYIGRDARRIKWVLVVGSLIPLLIYLAWNYVILGLMPMAQQAEWLAAQDKGEMVTQLLADTVGSGAVLKTSVWFAFFAIASSVLPVGMSFVDFLADGFSSSRRPPARSQLAALVLVPPLMIAVADPHLFLSALNIAGGICAVGIFGLLPAIMGLRRQKQLQKSAHNHYFLARPWILWTMAALSFAIMTMQLVTTVRSL